MAQHDLATYGSIARSARPACASLENIHFLKQIGAWTDEVTRSIPAQPAALQVRPSVMATATAPSFADILDATLAGC